MARSTTYKSVVVKEDPKTSLAEAGIHGLTLAHGQRAVAFGHAYFPNHDRNLHELVLQYLHDTRPELVLLLGGMVDEDAFRSLMEEQDNYIHKFEDAAEVAAARLQDSFEGQVLSLGRACGDYIKSFAQASGGTVVYIPSHTHLSMPNEVRLLEAILRKKKLLDAWSANHPDAAEFPSNPSMPLPEKFADLLQLNGLPDIHVTRFGAAVNVNGRNLFMIGDFRRRHPGDASRVEWEQRGMNIVRSFDGKLASGWITVPKHTLPGLVLEFHEWHEVGYLYDARRMGHLRDYDRRAPGFCSYICVDGMLFGSAIPIIEGVDGRRSFVDDVADCAFKVYTESTAGALPHGDEIKLIPAGASATATGAPAADATPGAASDPAAPAASARASGKSGRGKPAARKASSSKRGSSGKSGRGKKQP